MAKQQMDKAALDNHSRQLNPKDDTYWKSRGEEKPAPQDGDAQDPASGPSDARTPSANTPKR